MKRRGNNWKGGRKIKNGYMLVYDPDNVMADSMGYVRRARLVMAQEIGRALTKEEQVHHINGDKRDDRAENLMLFPSNSAHKLYEYRLEFTCPHCSESFYINKSQLDRRKKAR